MITEIINMITEMEKEMTAIENLRNLSVYLWHHPERSEV